MNNKRDLLISLSIKYQGQYFDIRKALHNNEICYIQNKQDCITILDKDYPEELLLLKYPPFVLFYKGDIELLKNKMMAVVGSRKMCTYGKAVTIDIVKQLNNNYTIVSGVALGIDRIAHEYAYKSIGVLGNGLNVIYPKENEKLYDYLANKQLLISEYPLDVKPQKYHFPWRNRIIAALAQGVIVSQADKHSGTMLTVNEALNLNKDIYAVVYPYNTKYGLGCNELIIQGANVICKDNLKLLFDK